MTNIKTPEEIANEICSDLNLFDHNENPSIECSTMIASALSAERNANLEKIKELEAEVQRLGNLTIADTENFKIQQLHIESLQKNLDLESKLAEAEKERDGWKKEAESIATSFERNIGNKMNEIAELEAEAKAVRSKTIEECAKVADEHTTMFWKIDRAQHQAVFMVTQAIRALNSKKGE